MATSKRSKHSRARRGVSLISPISELRIGWRARWKDPDNPDKLVTCTLSEDDARTVETRDKWATAKAQENAERRLDLDRGAPRATGTPIVKAIDGYYAEHIRLREKTLKGYRGATAKLLHWAAKSGVKTTDDITRARLMGLRGQLVNEHKRTTAEGGKRGARVIIQGKQRSAFSVNRELAALRTVLGYLYDLDLLSKVREGDLRRALKKLPVRIERPEFLQPAEVRAVLKAALKHDTATFNATRSEHSNKRKGETLRYEPVAPLIAVALLTGMRLGELLTLEWSQIDLDASDNDGRAVGEIKLTGETKTKRARVIDLAVSPALRALLLALRGDGRTGRLFALTDGAAEKIVERLKGAPKDKDRQHFGAPDKFGWQVLRATCSTYLTNAPGIFGAASAYRSAKQLGHSVAVAEKHYAGLVRGIPATARTLEAALGVEDQLSEVCRRVV